MSPTVKACGEDMDNAEELARTIVSMIQSSHQHDTLEDDLLFRFKMIEKDTDHAFILDECERAGDLVSDREFIMGAVKNGRRK